MDYCANLGDHNLNIELIFHYKQSGNIFKIVAVACNINHLYFLLFEQIFYDTKYQFAHENETNKECNYLNVCKQCKNRKIEKFNSSPLIKSRLS